MDANTLFAAAMTCGFLALLVAAWQPEHRCRWRDQCPHYRLDQARLERRAREAAERAARDRDQPFR